MNDQELRTQLVHLLVERQAHMDLTDAVADFPMEQINARLPNCNYTFWHLLEHMRIVQKDILDYVQAEHYIWLNFPDDYWPGVEVQTDLAGWQATLAGFVADRQRLVEIINDSEWDLFAPLPNSGEEQHNLLREIAVIAAHNSYHTGEVATARTLMGLQK
jgi:uncharacterized damage-inducible protein DinB